MNPYVKRGYMVSLQLIWAMSAFTLPVLARGLAFHFDPDQTKVEYTLGDILHTVHGSFRIKSGLIEFDPREGTAQGLIVVDATSGNSGSEGRDQKMHKDILESQRYPEITFKPTRVEGQIVKTQLSSLIIKGLLTLHGAPHPVTLAAQLSPGADQMSATTQFSIPYTKWGLKNPSTFLLRVSSTVTIDIRAVGHLSELVEQP